MNDVDNKFELSSSSSSDERNKPINSVFIFNSATRWSSNNINNSKTKLFSDDKRSMDFMKTNNDNNNRHLFSNNIYKIYDSDDNETLCSASMTHGRSISKFDSLSTNNFEIVRPVTARSLPTKVQSELDYLEFDANPSSASSLSTNVLSLNPNYLDKNFDAKNDIYLANKKSTNNLSSKLINDETIKSYNNNYNSKINESISNATRKDSNIPYDSKLEFNKTKTNLDYYLDFASNPFTTKYEMIGPLSTSKKLKEELHANQKFAVNNNYASTYAESKLTDSTSSLRGSFKSKKHEPRAELTLVEEFKTGEQTNNEIMSISKNPSSSEIFLNLKCSISDEKLSDYDLDFDDPKSIKSLDVQQTQYNFLEVNEYLVIGNINSIKNERKMCRLDIEYLIDMSNMRPDDLNRKTLGRLPCLCKRQHSRLNLSIKIEDTSFKNLFSLFTEVNRFIQKARSSNGKRILIFGKETLDQQVLCVCCQYIMVEYEIDLETAWKIVLQKSKAKNEEIRLDKCYLDFLNEFELYLTHISLSIFGNARVKSLPDWNRNNDQKIPKDSTKSTTHTNQRANNYLISNSNGSTSQATANSTSLNSSQRKNGGNINSMNNNSNNNKKRYQHVTETNTNPRRSILNRDDTVSNYSLEAKSEKFIFDNINLISKSPQMKTRHSIDFKKYNGKSNALIISNKEKTPTAKLSQPFNFKIAWM